MVVGGGERFFCLKQRVLIKHQTNWVFGGVCYRKCFVWKSCASNTHRRSRREKSAPGCPKSSRFSGQKSAGQALEAAGSGLRVLEQIAKPRAKTSAARSDCRPRRGQTDGQAPSGWQAGRGWRGADGQMMAIATSEYGLCLLFFPNDRSWLRWIFL